MPRRIIYGISLWLFLGAFACTLASTILPNWIAYTTTTSHSPIRITYGLHQRCSSLTGCQPFPSDADCAADDGEAFCSIWRSTGFALNFAVMGELACFVTFVVVLVGGRGVRESGWRVLAALLACVAAAQVVGMALVTYLYEHDRRFFVGWELDKSWVLCTVSWVVLLIDAVGLIAAAVWLPSEDGYERIPEPQ